MKMLPAFICTAILCSCSLPPQTDEDFFYVSHKGADMPVWIKGRLDSGVYIFLFNGMGSPGPLYRYFAHADTVFGGLEANYALVYWDQRSSGSSQGSPSPDTMTLEQFTEDAKIMVDIVRARHSISSIFIWGGSYGGAVAAQYLADPVRQGEVKGFIDMDGALNMAKAFALSRQKVIEYANARLNDPSTSSNDMTYWQQALAFYAANPVITDENRNQHAGYVVSANGMMHDWANYEMKMEIVFSSPVNLFQMFNSANRINTELQIATMDVSAEFAVIACPSLVMWGRYDLINPVEMADDSYALLGTDPAHKKLVIGENSGHAMILEDADITLVEIAAFIEAYK
jgi:proline iminopeptidase